MTETPETLPARDSDDRPDDNVGDIVDPDIELEFLPAEDEDGGGA